MLGHVHALGYYLTVEKNELPGTSLVVQWLKLQASTAGRIVSIPGQGIKIPHATMHHHFFFF